jgi:hypothetical protein
LKPSNTNGDDAQCTVCQIQLRAHRADLGKHSHTRKHIDAMKKFQPPSTQKKILPFCKVESTDTKRRELLLAAHIACHSSVRTVDHLSEVMVKIYPESSKDISLHRTKCSALINKVLAPNILSEIINEDIGGGGDYSLLLDESTDVSCVKFLCVCIKYFSKSCSTVIATFLGMIQVTSTTADTLSKKVLDFLEKVSLDPAKCVGLATDGVNNMCGVNNSVFTKLRINIPHLVLIKYVCHSLHLCASHAAQTLPANLDFLLREAYSWFSNSATRKASYKEIFMQLNGGSLPAKLLSLSTTRWLSRSMCINRILDQWDT